MLSALCPKCRTRVNYGFNASDTARRCMMCGTTFVLPRPDLIPVHRRRRPPEEAPARSSSPLFVPACIGGGMAAFFFLCCGGFALVGLVAPKSSRTTGTEQAASSPIRTTPVGPVARPPEAVEEPFDPIDLAEAKEGPDPCECDLVAEAKLAGAPPQRLKRWAESRPDVIAAWTNIPPEPVAVVTADDSSGTTRVAYGRQTVSNSSHASGHSSSSQGDAKPVHVQAYTDKNGVHHQATQRALPRRR